MLTFIFNIFQLYAYFKVFLIFYKKNPEELSLQVLIFFSYKIISHDDLLENYWFIGMSGTPHGSSHAEASAV